MRASPGSTSASLTLFTLLPIVLLTACSGSSSDQDSGVPDLARDVALVDLVQDATPDAKTEDCKDGWCRIPVGQLTLGSPTSDKCREYWPNNKETQHTVTLTRPFEIARYEVTQKEFSDVMGSNPSKYIACGQDCPVERVSWHQAAAYCNALSRAKGLTECYACGGALSDAGAADASVDAGNGPAACAVDAAYRGGGKTIYDCVGYRLPTEAEWEHAYHAGTTTTFYNGVDCPKAISAPGEKNTKVDPIGWYSANAAGSTHPVGKKLPNAWGLYDMAGNALEWANDFHAVDLGTAAATDPVGPATGSCWVLKGGGAECPWVDLRGAFRHGYPAPCSALSDLIAGFRCARTLK